MKAYIVAVLDGDKIIRTSKIYKRIHDAENTLKRMTGYARSDYTVKILTADNWYIEEKLQDK